jgi:hypothetical protein
MHCAKRPGQRLMARDFDRQVTEVQVRIAVMNGLTAPGIPVTDSRAMNPSGEAITSFVPVWTLPLVQVIYERRARVIRCGHVSGL